MRRGLAGACALALTGAASGDVITLEPAKDNTLYESPLGALSNGIGEYMFCGVTAQGLKRRAVLMFDLVGAVPPGATINSVTLQLSMSMTIAGPNPTSVHRVLADWGEGQSLAAGAQGSGGFAAPGDATWLHRSFSSTLWASAGGDFAAAPSASSVVDGVGLYTWSGAGLVQDVEQWTSAPASNFGWLLMGNEALSTTAKRFDTREQLNPDFRPKLTIDFTPCYPDCNGDGNLNLADFGCFQTKFALNDPYADCNGDTVLNLADFGCFQTRFALGCP